MTDDLTTTISLDGGSVAQDDDGCPGRFLPALELCFPPETWWSRLLQRLRLRRPRVVAFWVRSAMSTGEDRRPRKFVVRWR